MKIASFQRLNPEPVLQYKLAFLLVVFEVQNVEEGDGKQRVFMIWKIT